MKESAAELLDKGLEAKSEQKYDIALEYYEEAIKIGEGNILAKVYYNKGVLLKDCLNNNKDALVCYQKATSINRDYHKAWHNMGNVLLSLLDHDGALKAFKEANKLENNYMSLSMIAYTLNRLGRFNEALDINTSIIEGPENCDFADLERIIYSELGFSLISLNRYEEALDYLEDAFKLDELNYEVCYNLAFVYDALNNYETALTFYDKAIALNTNERKGFQGKAVSYIKMKHFDKAIPLIESAINLSPENFEGYYNLACIYAGTKEKENFITAIKNTIRYAPKEIRIQTHLIHDPDLSFYANDFDFKQLLN